MKKTLIFDLDGTLMNTLAFSFSSSIFSSVVEASPFQMTQEGFIWAMASED